MRAAAVIAFLAAVAIAGALVLARCGGGAEEATPAPPVTEAEQTGLLVGLEDDAQVLTYREETLRTMSRLGVDLTRFQLRWDLIAPTRPADPERPDDPAYAWTAYDEAVIVAKRRNIRILFSILGTPAWANGGQAFNYAPDDIEDLRAFALAAARRYSGTFQLPDGRRLPKVDLWAAWNEPNLPFFLRVAEREPGVSPADGHGPDIRGDVHHRLGGRSRGGRGAGHSRAGGVRRDQRPAEERRLAGSCGVPPGDRRGRCPLRRLRPPRASAESLRGAERSCRAGPTP